MKVKWDDKKLQEAVRKKATQRLIRAAETVRTTCIKSMGSGKHSEAGYKAYKRTKKKILHWSSKPGQPPHVDTGRLRSSVTWAISEGAQQGNERRGTAQQGDQVRIPRKQRKRIIAVVGTNVEYAKALEFGFEPRNLKARPYLRPALKNAAAKIRYLFANE